MNRDAVGWIVGAIAVLGLAALGVILGMNLMPGSTEMHEKLGTRAPLIVTWGMIWTTVLISVVLAGFLIATGVSKSRHSQ
jgi:hypothetical protein